jgi:hypothetical protein
MSKEPEYLRKLREYARTDLSFEELIAIEKELYGVSDRASAVILSTITEDTLRGLLLSKMRSSLNSGDRKQLFGFEGALGTFAAKITTAYALELIGPISRADLNLIRFLRNSFAHSRKPMNFEVPEVRAVCAKLKFPDLAQITVPWGPMHRLPEPEESDKDHPRTRYRLTCHNLTTRFIVMTSPSLSGELASTDLLPSDLLP